MDSLLYYQLVTYVGGVVIFSCFVGLFAILSQSFLVIRPENEQALSVLFMAMAVVVVVGSMLYIILTARGAW